MSRRFRPRTAAGALAAALFGVVAARPAGAQRPAPPAPPAGRAAPALPAAAAPAGPPAEACDPDQLRALGEFQLRLRGPAALARAEATARPGAVRGYLGLRLSEVSATAWTPEGRVVRYCAYPLVVSVEPASPAERGGVDAGDTIVAYAGRDVVRDGPVALDRLLVPGRVLRVHVRRNGRTLTRAVTVGRAPAPQIVALGPAPGSAFDLAFSRAGGRAPGATGGRVPVSVGDVPVALAGPPAGSRLARDLAALEARAARDGSPGDDDDARPLVIVDGVPVRGLPFPPPAEPGRPLLDYLRALPVLPATAWATGAPAALAGAQVVALDEDLREVLARGAAVDPDAGPVRGVFVLKVLPGTPAAEAGLRAGDVVTAADGRLVATPAALQRVLAGRELAGRGGGAAARRALGLAVWRGGRVREVVLRW